MPPGKFQGSRRGIFGLKSWDVDLPGLRAQTQSENTSQTRAEAVSKPAQKKAASCDNWVENQTILLAKHRYAANKTNSPLGVEFDLAVGDECIYLKRHDAHWLFVEKGGEQGYVPAAYVVNRNDIGKGKALPWLPDAEESPAEPKPEGKVYHKKYRSTYEHEEVKKLEMQKFYCEVCAKQLNGPQPYNAHMNSKGHKEMVEYYGDSAPS